MIIRFFVAAALFGTGSVPLAAQTLGTVVVWGDNFAESTLPAGLSGVVAVAAGVAHSLALKSDGSVVAWGNVVLVNDASGLSAVPAGLDGVVAVAAGWGYSLVLKSDGTVVAWGGDLFGESTVPVGLSEVVAVAAVAAGDYHSLALKSDGTVVAWGRDHFGESTVPAGLSGVVAVAAGDSHSLALVRDTVPPPSLAVDHVSGVPVLSWPSPAEGYALESAPGLTAPVWSAVTDPPTLIEGRFRVTNAVTGPAQFFRLRKQW